MLSKVSRDRNTDVDGAHFIPSEAVVASLAATNMNSTESIGRWVSIYQGEIAVSRAKSEETKANYPNGDKNVFFDNPGRSMTPRTF